MGIEDRCCNNCRHSHLNQNIGSCGESKVAAGLPYGGCTEQQHWQPLAKGSTDMQQIIAEECDAVKDLLLAKNKAYGNSAAKPLNIFSKASAIERINIRIEDKLKRIKDGQEYGNEDTEQDLIGYLILKRCVKRFEQEEAGGGHAESKDIR